MEQRARVRSRSNDGTAVVAIIRQSACSGDCHKCSGCGAVEQTLLVSAVNTIGALPGEVVTIRSESGPVLKGAAVLYMIPLVLFFLGYFLGERFLTQGALVGCLAFLGGLALAVVYDRLVAGKTKTVYTITGYGPGPAHTEGEHGID